LVSELEKDGYDYIASDRYFYDSVVNIQYLSLSCHPEFISGSDFKPQEMLKQVQHDNYNIVKSDIAIYLQTDPDIIMQRERKPDQGIEYLQNKKELYDKAASTWNLKIINGNRNKEEIFEEIKKGF
jgi:thymidylate kinase